MSFWLTSWRKKYNERSSTPKTKTHAKRRKRKGKKEQQQKKKSNEGTQGAQRTHHSASSASTQHSVSRNFLRPRILLRLLPLLLLALPLLLLLDLLARARDGDAQRLRAHGKLAGFFDDRLIDWERRAVDLDDVLLGEGFVSGMK